MKIEIKDRKFYIDGRAEQIISGAMHYFRVPRSEWRDRLLKLKEMGCNCVETYCAWNLHEPFEGEYNFSGILDLDAYISLAEEFGLYVVVRPGPYICAECDMGGLPWWLLKYSGMQLRSSDPRYLEKTEPYLEKICGILRPHLASAGGGVIMVQIENEYGGYGNDKTYLLWLKAFFLAHGIDCLLVTSDSEFDLLTYNGTLQNVAGMVNCFGDVKEKWKIAEKYRGDCPPAVMEFWTGKSPRFGVPMEDDTETSAKELEKALRFAEFINIFKFHGGTNFGFFGGSVRGYLNKFMEYYRPAYDIYSPLDEFGRRTKKYYRFRDVICKKRNIPITETACDVSPKALGKITKVGQIGLENCPEIVTAHQSVGLFGMEFYDQGYGYIVYETTAFVGEDGVKLILPEVHDIAHIYIDGNYLKTVHRDEESEIIIKGGARLIRLSILVENLGRIKFGPGIEDRKGLIGDMYFYELGFGIFSKLFHFDVWSLPMDKLPKQMKGEAPLNTPVFYEYYFEAAEQSPAQLEVEGFTRGVVFVNGVNLGRYWGGKLVTDRRLYLPADAVNCGHNRILIFDVLENGEEKKVRFVGEE